MGVGLTYSKMFEAPESAQARAGAVVFKELEAGGERTVTSG